MLKLLLDENISPVVGEQARVKCPGIRITTSHEWRAGNLLGAGDEEILSEARRDGLTLVTYDLRTIPPLLKRWAEAGADHAGVVFVDHKTIAPQDFGGLVAALSELWRQERRADWINRVVFLRSPK
jgi:hypothetical protein